MSFCRYKTVLLGGFVCLIFGHSRFGLAREDVVPGSRYTSARGAAMGDAFLPVGEDGSAGLFYNPAVIGKIRAPQLEPVNLTVHTNGQFVGLISLSNFYQASSLSSYAPTLIANPGVNSGFGAQLLPNYYMKGFAFGILMQTNFHAVALADGSIKYRSSYQFVPAIGTGVKLAGGIVRIGYSLQWVNQASGTVTAPAGSTFGFNQGLAEGSALSHNFGLAMTLPISYLPQLDLVARNVLGADYSMASILPLARNASGTIPTEPMSLDASFSIQPKVGQGNYANLVYEQRDLTNVSGDSLIGRMALGGEFSLRDYFFIRGGLGGGYPTAGFGMKRKGGEFSFTWYSEEIGSGYLGERDIRFMFQYQVRLFSGTSGTSSNTGTAPNNK